MEEASDLRDKEHEDYLAAKDEMEKAIAALEQAVEVLAEATAEKEGSLLSFRREMSQFKEGEHAEATVALQRALDLGKRYLDKGDATFLEKVLSGDVPNVDWKKLNRKATFKMKYKARSLKIQEILADMLQTFQDNLADAEKKEADAKSSFDTLMGSKNSQLSAAQDALSGGEGEAGARALSMEESQAEVDALTEQVTN